MRKRAMRESSSSEKERWGESSPGEREIKLKMTMRKKAIG